MQNSKTVFSRSDSYGVCKIERDAGGMPACLFGMMLIFFTQNIQGSKQNFGGV